MDFLVRRDDLHECRVADTAVPDLGQREALLGVDAFGLTSNNITYAVFGEAMSYWGFFPAEEGWGRIPVWGFADVVASSHDGLEAGTRVFGYLPMSTQLVVAPDGLDEQGFVDSSPHRPRTGAVYNRYLRVAADPAYEQRYEDQQMLLRPLFVTSFLIDDFLADNDFFGAGAVVLSSASSKTALGTAFLLSRRDGIGVIGLTSPANAGFVEGVGAYDRVVTYENVASLPEQAAVYVDIAGDGSVRDAVHHHYGEALAHSAMVGATHWERMDTESGELPGPQPTLFFAPDRVSQRTKDWGQSGFGERLGNAWRPCVEWAEGWLKVSHGRGPEAVKEAYLEVLDGRIDPSTAHVLSMSAA